MVALFHFSTVLPLVLVIYLKLSGEYGVAKAQETQVDPLAVQQTPKHMPNVDVLALSGYDMIYDHETFPIFERRQPMKKRNVVATFPEPELHAKAHSTSFQNLKSQLENLKRDKNVQSFSSIGGGKSGARGGGSLGLSGQMSKSKIFKKMANTKQKEDRRFMRVNIDIRTFTVILNTGNMILDPGFLHDLTKLPTLPNWNETFSASERLADDSTHAAFYKYLLFFGKYGTHYRRRSYYGGNLQFIYSIKKSNKMSETRFKQSDEYCSSASLKGCFSKGQDCEESLNNHDDTSDIENAFQNSNLDSTGDGEDLNDQDSSRSFAVDLVMQDGELDAVEDNNIPAFLLQARISEPSQEGNAWDAATIKKDPNNMRGIALESYCLLPGIRAEGMSGRNVITDFLKESKKLEASEKAQDEQRRRRRSSLSDIRLQAHMRGSLRRLRGRSLSQTPEDLRKRKSQIVLSSVKRMLRMKGQGGGSPLTRLPLSEALARNELAEELIGDILSTGSSMWLSSPVEPEPQEQRSNDMDEGMDGSGEDQDAADVASKLQSSPPKDIGAKISLSYSKCMAAMQEQSDMSGEMKSEDTYDVYCTGGISCNNLLFLGPSDPSVLKSEISKWALSVWNYPMYLKSDAKDYVPLSDVFVDTIHFKGEAANENPIVAEQIRKSVYKRRRSMEIAIAIYFYLHDQDLDGDFFCSHVPCSKIPSVLANGDCFCPDNACNFDLLTRLSQAGGAFAGDVAGRFEGSSLKAACEEDQFYDTISKKCKSLFEAATPSCSGSGKELFVDVHSGMCLEGCNPERFTTRFLDIPELCLDQTDRINMFLSMFNAGGYGATGSTKEDVSQQSVRVVKNVIDTLDTIPKPDLCKTKIKYCVPFCGGGTYRYRDTCVVACPDPYKADDSKGECVSACALGMVTKKNKVSGMWECSDSCGIDIKVDYLDSSICIPNTPLGFYNITVHEASAPSLSCAKGGVLSTKVGNLFMDGTGVAKVSPLSPATTFLITSVNSEDILDVWKTVNAYFDVYVSFENIKNKETAPDSKAFEILFNLLSDTGCPTYGQRFPTGSFVKGSPKFGTRARFLMVFDARTLVALAVDPLTNTLRYQSKGERPSAFLVAGSLGGMGATCSTFLSDNFACAPYSIMRDYINNSTVTGNFFPPLHYDHLSQEIRQIIRPYSAQTFFAITPLDKINTVTGRECTSPLSIFREQSTFDIPIPLIPRSARNLESKTVGFGYVSGGFPFKLMKMSYMPSGVFSNFHKTDVDTFHVSSRLRQFVKLDKQDDLFKATAFENFFFEHVESSVSVDQTLYVGSSFYTRQVQLNIDELQDAYVLSDPSADCFIACLQLLDCYVFCNYGSETFTTKKRLSDDIVAKFTNFSAIPASALRGVIVPSNLTSAAVGAGDCQGKDVSFNCWKRFLNSLKGTSWSNHIRDLLESSLLTKSYAFYSPPSEVDFYSQNAGSEAFNFKGLADSYKANITAWIGYAEGERLAQARTLLNYIKSHQRLISFEPKSQTMYDDSVDIINKIHNDYMQLGQKPLAVQLTAGDVVLMHICLFDQSVALYNKTRRDGYVNRKQTVRHEQKNPFEMPKRFLRFRRSGNNEAYDTTGGDIQSLNLLSEKGNEALLNPLETFGTRNIHVAGETKRLFGNESFEYVKNITRLYNDTILSPSSAPKRLYEEKGIQSLNCKEYQQSRTFCLIGLNPSELSTVKFYLHHRDGSTIKSREYVQVCSLKYECRSNRFLVPGTRHGYVQFVMDFRNRVLRFDLLGYEVHESASESWLTYLSHSYAQPECFSNGKCYDTSDDGEWSSRYATDESNPSFSQHGKLILRRDTHSGVFEELKLIHIDMIRITENDEQYFASNPMAAYILPCKTQFATNLQLNKKMLIAVFVSFVFGNAFENEQVLFAYHCEGACERRTLSVGVNIGKQQDVATFKYSFTDDVSIHDFERLLGSAPEVSKQRIVWQRQVGLPSDAYDLSVASLPIDRMEYILRYTEPYKDILKDLQNVLKKGDNSVYTGFATLAEKISGRLGEHFQNITLSGSTTSILEKTYGEMYRLTQSPGDEFARSFSELKTYALIANTTIRLLNSSANIVSRNQVRMASLEMNTLFDTMLAESHYSNGTVVPGGISWRRIQIDRAISKTQLHCLNYQMKACIMGQSNIALFVRYEMNIETGQVDIQMLAPCSHDAGTTPCEIAHIFLEDIKGSNNGIFTIKKDKYVVAFSRTPEHTDKLFLSKLKTMHPVSAKTFLNETNPTQLSGLFRALGCKSNFDILGSIFRRNCSCVYPYAPPSCKCNTQLHFYEAFGGVCKCDYERNFAPSPENDKTCVCDSTKGLKANPRNPDECICSAGSNMIFNNVTGMCECNEQAGFYADQEMGICIPRQMMIVELVSVRRVRCLKASESFNFQNLECDTMTNPKEDARVWSNAGSFNNAKSTSIRFENEESTDPGSEFANSASEAKVMGYKDVRAQLAAGAPIGDIPLDINDPVLLETIQIYSPYGLTKLTSAYYVGDNIVEAKYQCKIAVRPNGFSSHIDIQRLGFNTIVEIHIANISIDYIPDNFFYGMRNVYLLKIEKSSLTSLSSSLSFASLDSLNELSLANNKIKSINYGAFDLLKRVKSIDLRGNVIASIEARLFCHLKSLVKLFVDSDVDLCMPVNVFNSRNFRIETSKGLSFMPSKDLNIRYKCTNDKICSGSLQSTCRSAIGALPPNLLCRSQNFQLDEESDLHAQVVLQMEDSDGETLQVTNIKFSSFFSVSTRRNMKVKFDDRLIDLTKFSTLIIRNANIGIFSTVYTKDLHFISKYVLHNCGITGFESGVFRSMTMLSHLYVTGNNITSIDESDLSGAGKIEVLNLGGNQIRYVNEKAFRMGSLKELYLSGNVIEHLSVQTFTGLPNLRILELGSNRIHSFPKHLFRPLTSLQTLDISGNVNGIIYNLFDDLPSTPYTISVGIFSIVCLPYRLFASTAVLPVKDVSFCRDPTETRNQDALCPSELAKCPLHSRVCTSNSECNLSRFKGSFSFCTAIGTCSCGEYLTGALCNIPSATISARARGITRLYFNVPLFLMSLQRYVPSDSNFLVIETPFFDNALLNGGVLKGLKKLQAVEIKLLIPPTEDIVPGAQFFLDHPHIVELSNVKISYPDKNARDLTRFLLNGDTNYRSDVNIWYKEESSDRSGRSDVNPGVCTQIRTVVLETVKAAMFRVEPDIAHWLGLIMDNFNDIVNDDDEEGCGDKKKEPVDKQYQVFLTSESGWLVLVGSSLIEGKQEKYRIVVSFTSSEVEALEFMSGMPCVGEPVSLNIVIDTASQHWPNVPLICGYRINLIQAPKLLSISPLHYSENIRINKNLLSRVYINYGSKGSKAVICEPGWLFRSGKRVNQINIECYDCEVPHKCDFVIFNFISNDSAGKITTKTPVYTFLTQPVQRISLSICTKLKQVALSIWNPVEEIQSIRLEISSCNSILHFTENLCEPIAVSNVAILDKVEHFLLTKYGSSDTLVCDISEVNLMCLSGLKKLELSFFTESATFLGLPSSYLTQKEDALLHKSTVIPFSGVLVLQNTDVASALSSFFEAFSTILVEKICNRHALRGTKCKFGTSSCFACLVTNYKSKCFDDVCPSSVNSVPCSGHGECINGVCECHKGWDSSDCSHTKCSGDPHDLLQCSGRGICNRATSKCSCFDGISAGSYCDQCNSNVFCFGEGVCMSGKCMCSTLHGGEMCSYPIVAVSLGFRTPSGSIGNLHTKIALKPFMFANPYPESKFLPEISSIESIRLASVISPTGERMPPITSIPPFTFFGLHKLKSLDLTHLQYGKNPDIESIPIVSSARAFETVTNLERLSLPLTAIFCASKVKQFFLKNLNMWLQDCSTATQCCTKENIVPMPPSVQIYSRIKAFGSRKSTFVSLNCGAWTPPLNVIKGIRYDFSIPIVWTSYPTPSSVQCVSKSTASQSIRLSLQHSRLQTSSTQNVLETQSLLMGSKIVSKRTFGYGRFNIKLDLPCKLAGKSRYASVWLGQAGNNDSLERNYEYPCSGYVKILELFYTCLESKNSDCHFARSSYDFPSTQSKCLKSKGRAWRNEILDFSWNGTSPEPYILPPTAFVDSEPVVDCYVSSDDHNELKQFEIGFIDACSPRWKKRVTVLVQLDWSNEGFSVDLSIPEYRKGTLLSTFLRTNVDVPMPFDPHKLIFQYGTGLQRYRYEKRHLVYSDDYVSVKEVQHSDMCNPKESSVYIVQEQQFPECDFGAFRDYLVENQFKRFGVEQTTSALEMRLDSPFCTVIVLPWHAEEFSFQERHYAVVKMKERCLSSHAWKDTLQITLRKLGMFYVTKEPERNDVHLSCAAYDAGEKVWDRRRIHFQTVRLCIEKGLDCFIQKTEFSDASSDDIAFFTNNFIAMNRVGAAMGGNTLAGFSQNKNKSSFRAFADVGQGTLLYYKNTFAGGFHIQLKAELDIGNSSYDLDDVLFGALIVPQSDLLQLSANTNTTSESIEAPGKYLGYVVQCADKPCAELKVKYGVMYNSSLSELYEAVYSDAVLNHNQNIAELTNTQPRFADNRTTYETRIKRNDTIYLNFQECFAGSPIFVPSSIDKVAPDNEYELKFHMYEYDSIAEQYNALVFQTHRKIKRARISEIKINSPGSMCRIESCDDNSYFEQIDDSYQKAIEFISTKYSFKDGAVCPDFTSFYLKLFGTCAVGYLPKIESHSIEGRYAFNGALKDSKPHISVTSFIDLNKILVNAPVLKWNIYDLRKKPKLKIDFHSFNSDKALVSALFSSSENAGQSAIQMEIVDELDRTGLTPLWNTHTSEASDQCGVFIHTRAKERVSYPIEDVSSGEFSVEIVDLLAPERAEACESSCFLRIGSEEKYQYLPLSSWIHQSERKIQFFIDSSMLKYPLVLKNSVLTHIKMVDPEYDVAKKTFSPGSIPIPIGRIASQESTLYTYESAVDLFDSTLWLTETNAKETCLKDLVTCLSYLKHDKSKLGIKSAESAYIVPLNENEQCNGTTSSEHIPDAILAYPLKQTEDVRITLTMVTFDHTDSESIDPSTRPSYPDSGKVAFPSLDKKSQFVSLFLSTRKRLFEQKAPSFKLNIHFTPTAQGDKDAWSLLFPYRVSQITSQDEYGTNSTFETGKISHADVANVVIGGLQDKCEAFTATPRCISNVLEDGICVLNAESAKSLSPVESLLADGSYERLYSYGWIRGTYSMNVPDSSSFGRALCRKLYESDDTSKCVEACILDTPSFLQAQHYPYVMGPGRITGAYKVRINFSREYKHIPITHTLNCTTSDISIQHSKENEGKSKKTALRSFSAKRNLRCDVIVTITFNVDLEKLFRREEKDFPIFGFSNHLPWPKSGPTIGPGVPFISDFETVDTK
eukprot:Nk52_evm8s485 gene=Nk52_evmTU8s485